MSWQITFDFPEELQFCAYLGQQEGFRIDNVAAPGSPAEAEWRMWWEALPSETFGTRFEKALKEMPDVPPRQVLQRVNPREQSGFDPPHFADLIATPALQKLCQSHWPTFHHSWGTVGGAKMPTITRMQAQLQNVRIDKLVQECVRATKKLRSRPFHLRVDFVVWPEHYRRDISDHHLVLGAQYIEPAQAIDLRAVLKSYVTRLV